MELRREIGYGTSVREWGNPIAEIEHPYYLDGHGEVSEPNVEPDVATKSRVVIIHNPNGELVGPTRILKHL